MGVHPLTNEATMSMSFADLVKFIEKVGGNEVPLRAGLLSGRQLNLCVVLLCRSRLCSLRTMRPALALVLALVLARALPARRRLSRPVGASASSVSCILA